MTKPAKLTEPTKPTECTFCGICKLACPLYKISLNETASPRGKAILLKESLFDKALYLCTLCLGCETACILRNVELVEKIREFRSKLVRKGIVTDANKRMLANVRKYGNAIGKVEKGKLPTLFCC